MSKQELIETLTGAGYPPAMLAKMNEAELAKLQESAPEPGARTPEPPSMEDRIKRGFGLTDEQYEGAKREHDQV